MFNTYRTIPSSTKIKKTKLSYPITLKEAKRHLRVELDFTEDDEYISSLIEAATRKAEEYIGKDIAYTRNVFTFYDYSGDGIFIDEGHFIEVEEIVTDSSTLVTTDDIREYYNSFYIPFDNSVSTS